jgi:hypothetical protein
MVIPTISLPVKLFREEYCGKPGKSPQEQADKPQRPVLDVM